MSLPSLQSIFMSAKQDHLHSIIYSALRYCIRITCTGGVYTRLHQLQSGLEGIIEQLCLIPGHVKDMKTGITKEICSELNAKNLLSWCPVNIYDILAICKKIWRTSTTLNLLLQSNQYWQWTNELLQAWNFYRASAGIGSEPTFAFLCGKYSKLGFDFMLANGKCMERWY